MEPSSVPSTFRFRDHQQSENETGSDTISDRSSVSSETDEESELESMTGKGIRRLCMELLEIKEASDEDFHGNIFSNYSAFVGIYEEIKDMENELMQLRTHVAMQKMLVKDLIDGVYLKVLSEETIGSNSEELICDDSHPGNELQVYIFLETLDMLLSENRTDEALAILEMEQENFFKEDNTPSDMLMLYGDAISERKAMLKLKFTLAAENSRVSAAEFQKALVGIRRLGDNHLATRLLLKYYHTRIVSGTRNLLSSKPFLRGFYIRELSRLVFSMISQAAKSFVMLYGQTASYASEFTQWIQEEIGVFAVNFTKYVKSIAEISGGLSRAVEAMQFATSYCLLLETQRLMLQPLLMKHLRASMEDVLAKHIDHFKKVIEIFTSTDAWVLGRYLVSGILSEGFSYTVVGQQPEYCLLTNSGRKFVTLLQAISKDVTPLCSIQMEGFILSGLSNLFLEYIAILREAITRDVILSEKTSSGVILAESMPQQVSILANLSTLENLFASTVTSIFQSIDCTDSERTKSHPVGFRQQELDSCVMIIQEASAELRAQFFEQFIDRVVALDVCIFTREMCSGGEPGSGLTPSAAFQVLFLQLRKLNKLSEDNVFEADWLMDLTRELIKATFTGVSNNKKIWETNKGDFNFQHPGIINQFVLDMHFLVEATRCGQYFSKDPLVPEILLKAAFTSAGLNLLRDTDDDKWAKKAAAEAIEKLLEMEKTEDAARSSPDISSSEEHSEKEFTDPGTLSEAMKEESCSVDRSATLLTDIDEDLDNIEPENAAYDPK